jgi:hypothetical protein
MASCYTLDKVLTLKRCCICGQAIDRDGNPVLEANIDGTCYEFDEGSCLAMFNKFQNVYGKSFVSQLALTV